MTSAEGALLTLFRNFQTRSMCTPATISLEVSNADTSSFLVVLWFSKDVQNGFILNFTFATFLTVARVTGSMHLSTKALFSAKELWGNSV